MYNMSYMQHYYGNFVGLFLLPPCHVSPSSEAAPLWTLIFVCYTQHKPGKQRDPNRPTFYNIKIKHTAINQTLQCKIRSQDYLNNSNTAGWQHHNPAEEDRQDKHEILKDK